MAAIKVSDLRPTELEGEKVSDLELKNIIGGKKIKIDLDGDGKWDIKIKY